MVAAGAAVLTGQLSVGWHNDWLDAGRDAAAGRPDKPVAAGDISRRTVTRCALGALTAAVPLSFASGWRAGLVHLTAVLLAWSYNARLKATAVSFVPYAVAFPLLVAFVTLGGPAASWPPWWALAAAALLGCSAHLVNAVPDLADDLAAGVRGLPHRLGRARSVTATVVLLLAATAVESFGPGRPAGARREPCSAWPWSSRPGSCWPGGPDRAGCSARSCWPPPSMSPNSSPAAAACE